MEYNKKKKRVNGYSEGYNYPAGYYQMGGYDERQAAPKVEGSFWVPCREKGSRNSFCDDI